MTRGISLAACFILIIFLSGCVKTSKYEVARKDQALVGNRGVLMGALPEQDPDRERFKTITAVDVQIPPSKTYKEKKAVSKEGTVKSAPVAVKVSVPKAKAPAISAGAAKSEEAVLESRDDMKKAFSAEVLSKDEDPEKIEGSTAQTGEKTVVSDDRPTKYKVQEGDTLEKIAMKFYGKMSMWPVILEANKDAIKEPSRIYPGQEIIIPVLPKENTEAPSAVGSMK